jgi:hypothetical protein
MGRFSRTRIKLDSLTTFTTMFPLSSGMHAGVTDKRCKNRTDKTNKHTICYLQLEISDLTHCIKPKTVFENTFLNRL